MEVGDYIEIGLTVLGFIGMYFKMKYDIQKNKDSLTNLKTKVEKHIDDKQPKCMKRFEELNVDINKLKSDELLKERYQSQIVEKILQPVLKDLVLSMKEYTDSKIQIIQNEITVYQHDNQEFKKELKEYIKELKDENKEAIKELVAVIKNK